MRKWTAEETSRRVLTAPCLSSHTNAVLDSGKGSTYLIFKKEFSRNFLSTLSDRIPFFFFLK